MVVLGEAVVIRIVAIAVIEGHPTQRYIAPALRLLRTKHAQVDFVIVLLFSLFLLLLLVLLLLLLWFKLFLLFLLLFEALRAVPPGLGSCPELGLGLGLGVHLAVTWGVHLGSVR